MMNPLPQIGKAFSLVIQQEREMNSSISAMTPIAIDNEEIVAFQVHNCNGKPSYSKGKTQGFSGARGHNCVCTHRGTTNHIVETCFIKHGFSPGFKGKGKSQSVGNNP